jgi:hypothetical protein
LRNLPDDPDSPGRGRGAVLHKARDLYREAQGMFATLGESQHAGVVAEALLEIERELQDRPHPRANGNGEACTM